MRQLHRPYIELPPTPSPDKVIANRRWWHRLDPFPHFVAINVFVSEFVRELEQAFGVVLSRGCSMNYYRGQFSRNMIYSDAFGWDFPADIDGPLAFFYSKPWLDLLVGLTGIVATRDLNGALHHHPVGSASGSVHRDQNIGWFTDQPRADGANPMDLSRCSYTNGVAFEPTARPRKTVRAATMIYYLANPPWTPGDGGETGLYRTGADHVKSPAAVVPPTSNSILLFENGPRSYHSFIQNTQHPRNSVILWLHRSIEHTIADRAFLT
jgi:2OG-Fe(II) oxygenase superfamily